MLVLGFPRGVIDATGPDIVSVRQCETTWKLMRNDFSMARQSGDFRQYVAIGVAIASA